MRSEVPQSARPLRLLLVVDSHFPGNGGTEAQAQLLAELLQARGHRVQVLAPHLDKARPLTETIRGIAVERLPYPRLKSLGALILIARFARRLLRDRGKYDAVHIHLAKNLAAGAGLVQPWLGIPVMVKVSGAWEFEGGVLDPTLRRNPLVALLNACIRRVAFVQAISQKTRQKLLAAGYPERRIQMIPNAVDVSLFDRIERKPPHPDRPLRVIYVGRLQPVKGVAVLVAAWRYVQAAIPAARLVLVGDGPLRGELERQIDTLGIRSSVELPGRSSEVPRLLRTADVYVQPSFQEGLPNSVLEAMSAGLPIVATRVSGNEDLVREGGNGKLVAPGDPQQLARALIEVLADPALAQRMGLASRHFIDSRYAASLVLGLLEQAYRGAWIAPPAEALGAS
jgi:L-malate glycosyltransferase